MYAKSVRTPPRIEYAYQEQQRYSGGLVIQQGVAKGCRLSDTAIRDIADVAAKIKPKEPQTSDFVTETGRTK